MLTTFCGAGRLAPLLFSQLPTSALQILAFQPIMVVGAISPVPTSKCPRLPLLKLQIKKLIWFLFNTEGK